MGKIREFVDRFLLSKFEWKRKYNPEPEWTKEYWKKKAERAPAVYSWLFELTDEERKEIIKKGKEHCDKVWKLAEQIKRTELGQPEGPIILSNIEYQLAEEQLKKAGE